MIENLYCKIFVDTFEEYNNFFEIVKKSVSGQKIAVSGIASEWCDMDIRKNKEYIPENPDFLYWKFIIDTDPSQDVSEAAYINNIRRLVCFLKRSHKVICACDFEDIVNQ